MKRLLFVLIQVFFLVLGLVFLSLEAIERAEQIELIDFEALALSIGLGLPFIFVGLFFLFITWSKNYSSDQKRLRSSPAIFFIGQLGKYIPGPMMSVLGHGLLSKNESSSRAGIFASLKSTGYGLVSAGTLWVFLFEEWTFYQIIFASIALLANIISLTSLPDSSIRALLRIDVSMGVRTSNSQRVISLVSAYLMWAFFGISVFIIENHLFPNQGQDFAVLAIAYAVAHAAGVLAVFAPAGIGVREFVFESLTIAELGAASLVIAIVARLAHIVADLLLAMLSLFLVRKTGPGKSTGLSGPIA